MKAFTILYLLAAVACFTSGSSAVDSLRVSPSPLELVLNCDRVFYTTATNISVEVSFRNIGEKFMRPNDLPAGLSVVWDGKECKLRQPEKFFMGDGPPFSPNAVWRRSYPLSEFVIPPEALASGRHMMAVRDELSESNTFVFSAAHEAVFSKSNRQIFAESSPLTVFTKTQP